MPIWLQYIMKYYHKNIKITFETMKSISQILLKFKHFLKAYNIRNDQRRVSFH